MRWPLYIKQEIEARSSGLGDFNQRNHGQRRGQCWAGVVRHPGAGTSGELLPGEQGKGLRKEYHARRRGSDQARFWELGRGHRDGGDTQSSSLPLAPSHAPSIWFAPHCSMLLLKRKPGASRGHFQGGSTMEMRCGPAAGPGPAGGLLRTCSRILDSPLPASKSLFQEFRFSARLRAQMPPGHVSIYRAQLAWAVTRRMCVPAQSSHDPRGGGRGQLPGRHEGPVWPDPY